ncbi:uncharacterized protein LOC134822578 [Bolinopsis microptera]|uniref:uncharacterized protein LOC134822578 n=1 Tax=Bolinopsis microptera TaxID=2820187 RepID=UPI00307A4F5E
MNFVAKQVLKSKTGALTDKLDEVSKKCKEMLDSDEPEPPQPAQNLSEEEQMNQEAERRKQHYESFNAEREDQRSKMREKYGLKSEASSPAADTPVEEVVAEEEPEETIEGSEKKDCCVM